MSAICIFSYRRQRRLERQLKELRQERDSLARQALHDPLTDLPNRALFMNRLERALARSLRYRHPVAVLFLVSLRPIMHQRFATKMHHRFAAKVHRPVR